MITSPRLVVAYKLSDIQIQFPKVGKVNLSNVFAHSRKNTVPECSHNFCIQDIQNVLKIAVKDLR